MTDLIKTLQWTVTAKKMMKYADILHQFLKEAIALRKAEAEKKN